MSDLPANKKVVRPEKAKLVQDRDEHLEDEEKIMAGRHDVNYPAMLTKDVPGG
jgi:hypothetical protein